MWTIFCLSDVCMYKDEYNAPIIVPYFGGGRCYSYPSVYAYPPSDCILDSVLYLVRGRLFNRLSNHLNTYK